MFFDSIIITGPTASSKSDFAHKIAKKLNNSYIMNADSVQIYKGIENISASPFANFDKIYDSIDKIDYKLFSSIPLQNHLNVADYLELVIKEININKNKLPIFVGGTGYYINALLNGISKIPNIEKKYREKARSITKKDIQKDKSYSCLNLLHKDSQRLQRSLEVYFQTGKTIEEFYNKDYIKSPLKQPFVILINPDKKLLEERIDKRIQEMIKNGAINEAKFALNNNIDGLRAIGLSFLYKYINKEWTQEKTIDKWATATKQYVKRQKTWFRNKLQPNLIISHIPNNEDLQKTLLILKNS